MWVILISEIKYNAYWLLIALVLPVSFTIFGWSDIIYLTSSDLLKHLDLTLFISMGSFLMMFNYWGTRTKEKRNRQLALLTLKKNTIVATRLLIGVLPFLAIALYIELNRLILNENWYVYIDQISSQYAMFLIFLTIVSILFDLNFIYFKTDEKKKIYGVLILSTAGVISFLVFVITAKSILPPIGIFGGRIYFYSWGIIMSFVACLVFYKRESYLV